MFVGHLGLALGGKRAAPELPMWALVLAAQSGDWGDVLAMDLLRLPDAWRFTHSLPLVVLAAMAAATVWLARGGSARGGAVLAGLVVSHPLLDLVTGEKPLWPGSPLRGLGLYWYPGWDFALEVALLLAGWMAYRHTLPAAARRSRLGPLLLMALAVAQLLVDLALAFRNDVMDARLRGRPEPTALEWAAGVAAPALGPEPSPPWTAGTRR